MKKLTAEFLGTFILIFAGTGSIIANDVSGGKLTLVGIALTWGLTVLAMVYCLGDISGAHLNPAVTIGFWFAGRIPLREVWPYLGSQFLGAIAASLCQRLLFASHKTLGITTPSGTLLQSFVLELIVTFILMFVILNVSTGAKEKGITAGIAVGAVIVLEVLFAGPISGASMNPARSLGPAVVSGRLAHLWLYLIAPTMGAVLAVFSCRCVNVKGCCTPLAPELPR